MVSRIESNGNQDPIEPDPLETIQHAIGQISLLLRQAVQAMSIRLDLAQLSLRQALISVVTGTLAALLGLIVAIYLALQLVDGLIAGTSSLLQIPRWGGQLLVAAVVFGILYLTARSRLAARNAAKADELRSRYAAMDSELQEARLGLSPLSVGDSTLTPAGRQQTDAI